MSTARDLPEFSNPPVVEVTLSVQFERLEALRNPHVGLFWSELRNEFPDVEERPPLPPVFESFGVQENTENTFKLEVLEVPPVSRYWFLNRKGSELIQLQQDRFIVNWRKTDLHDEYPRYEHVEELFSSKLELFRKFLVREKLGTLVPKQCEITYVNRMPAGEGWTNPGDLGRIVTVWAPSYSDTFLSQPEDARLSVRYAIRDGSSEPMGRLNISVEPRYSDTERRMVMLMVLNARGKPSSADKDGVLEFLRVGRKWIVRGFTSITTAEMHTVWRRRDDS
jgi:uncharacterized protein (TIGR04255 family)